MNAIEILNKFANEREFLDEKIGQLFGHANFKIPTLNEDYYHLAERISKLPDFEEIAEALLTAESPQKINPQTLLRMWILVLNSLHSLAPSIEHELCHDLKQLFQNLAGQYADRKCTSSIWITKSIKNLQRGESFALLLPSSNAWGKSLENIVAYRKNEDDTFDIKLFYAKKNGWQEQSGEYALGDEKILPVRYFSHVSDEDLFGPKLLNDSSIHANLIVKALEDPDHAEKALIAAFNPLNSYLSKPGPSVRMVNVTHAHLLKGMHAFIYASIYEKIHSEQAVESYKAIMCVCRLALAIAVMKSFSNEKDEQMHSKLGLLSKAAMASAHYVDKQKNNRIVEPFYQLAAGTLEQLKDQAEKLQRQHILPEAGIREHKIQENQIELRKKALEETKQFIKAVDQAPILKKIDKKEILEDLAKVKDPPIDSALFVIWLKEIEKKLQEFSLIYPDISIPALNRLITQFELPTKDSIWLKMPVHEKRQCLPILKALAEQLVQSAFQHQMRFSLEVQNSGARLLIIAHSLAECIDEKKVLQNFKPALGGYRKLIASPYFQSAPYSGWQQRQEILKFLSEWNIPERKPIWNFRNKNRVSFNKTSDGIFAESLLNAYADVNDVIENHFRQLKQRREGEKLGIAPGQLLIAELLNIKIQNGIDAKLNDEDEIIHPLSHLVQIAMQVYILSDMYARYQNGYENLVKFQEGLSFDLTYAKTEKRRFDFHIEKVHAKIKIDKDQKNLLPKEKWLENQNETLHRFSKDEEALNELSSFEESSSEPALAALQLLAQAKHQLSHFDNPQVRLSFENYLFKIHVTKERKEFFSLLREMKDYPHVFNQTLQDFLAATDMFTKNLDRGIVNEQALSVFSLSIRLFGIAQKIVCQPVLLSLEDFLNNSEIKLKACLENLNEKQNVQHSAHIKVLLLQILELREAQKINWVHYFKWGSKLQEQLEQKEVVLDPHVQLWWSSMRWKMAQHFLELQKKDPEKAHEYINGENFDILGMSYGKGKWQPIPIHIQKDPEFIRLFSDRVRFWKVNEDNQAITFSDPMSGKYLLSDYKRFPYTLQRSIDQIWHSYIPDIEIVKNIHLPKSVRQESLWWLNPEPGNFQAKGYYKSKPNLLWLERNNDGAVVFKDGPEKGMQLELVENDNNSLTHLERNTGPFGLHYYAFNARIMQGHLMHFRDLLAFPNLRMSHGGKLVFERHEHKFYEQGNFDRELDQCFFAPFGFYEVNNAKHKSASYRMYGIQIKKMRKEGVRKEDETSIILPFERHVSEKHSHELHVLTPKINPDSPSQLNTIEVIEIKNNLEGFCPETPQECLFAAYLSLVGKNYHEAARFLKNIRPNHRLDSQERKILTWLIDSKEDAADHSAEAASIKLRAYKIWGEQGIPPAEAMPPKELPHDTLEVVYLDYINHIPSVPASLKLELNMEKWLLEKGFEYFPPSQENQELWNLRKKSS